MLMTCAVSEWMKGEKCCAETLHVTACLNVCTAFVPSYSHLPRGSSGEDDRQSRRYHGLSHKEEKRQGRGEGKGCEKSSWILKMTIGTSVSQE